MMAMRWPQFVQQPPDPLAALAQSVARLAAEGVFYTRRQLYYEVCLTLASPLTRCATLSRMGAVSGAALFGAMQRLSPFWAGVLNTTALTIAPALVWRLPFTLTPPLTDAAFAELLAAYRARHGEPAGLLADEPSAPPVFGSREPDLCDYGVSCAIVCHDASIARMLRANALHMELSCAILSLSEASSSLTSARRMLLLAPEPIVIALHDASWEGLEFADNARALLDLPPTVQLRAPGLFPRHALRQHLFAIRRAAAAGVAPIALGVLERAWLEAGYVAELAALRPVTLLRALRRVVYPEQRRSSWLTELRRWPSTGYMTWPD